MDIIELKEKFIELMAKGLSFDEISLQLGKSKETLAEWNRMMEEEIEYLKTIEIEKLCEKFYLEKETRLRTLDELLTKIKKSLENKKISDIPSDKLLELLLKYNSKLK